MKEQEVNAYTGHSNNAHTALTNYFHLEESLVDRSLLVLRVRKTICSFRRSCILVKKIPPREGGRLERRT
jgi:hypothetical protein